MLEKFNEIFPKKANINIMQGVVDAETQIEYFDYIMNHRKAIDREKLPEEKNKLFDVEVDLEDKKNLLANLAFVPEVEIYRTLEKYAQNPDPELKSWSQIALQENLAILKGTLLEESQVFISTGLGGEGNKLRYFIVMMSKNDKPLTDVQKAVVKKELDFELPNSDSELEKLEFGENFVNIQTLIPFGKSIQSVFKKIIDEINLLGDFMSNDYMVSNVKAYTKAETVELIEEVKQKIKEEKEKNNKK